jgi:hypothetical protein
MNYVLGGRRHCMYNSNVCVVVIKGQEVVPTVTESAGLG